MTRRKSWDVTKAEDIEARLKIAQRREEISDISDQRSGSGAAMMERWWGFATEREERFIAQKTCDGKEYLTSPASGGVGMTGSVEIHAWLVWRRYCRDPSAAARR